MIIGVVESVCGVCWACGAAGITLGHYDAATLERLETVGEGLRFVGAADGRLADERRTDHA